MISSTFPVCVCIFVIGITVSAQNLPQNPEKKTATSTISGKVTIKGKGVAGISVSARAKQSRPRGKAPAAVTDAQGNYRLTNLPPGTYEISPAAPQFALLGAEPIKTLTVGEDETVEGVDFAMVRGGVITGRITDDEGKPVIEEEVVITGPEVQPFRPVYLYLRQIQTDDRGVYRVFGLAPGQYSVSVGMGDERFFFSPSSRPRYKRTYYPSTTDPKKAGFIEVTEGGEATNIDITLRGTNAGFSVSGQIVDEATGRPQPNVRYGLTAFREGGSSSGNGMAADATGEFRFENLPPGKYAVFVEGSNLVETYADPVHFEITDQDVKGLVLKLSNGGSISGSIVLEGIEEKAARARFKAMMIIPQVETSDQFGVFGWSPASVNEDGSFRIGGLRPGAVQFMIRGRSADSNGEYDLARIERNGQVVARSVEIKAGEKIAGVRLIIRKQTSGIRGVVKIENGQIESTDVIYVSVKRVGDEHFNRGLNLDSRGRFLMDGLTAGVYEVTATVYGRRNFPATTKQEVVVTEDQVSEVILTLDLEKRP